MAFSGCDTTEDEYYPGDEPTDVLSVSGEIFLNAGGTAQTLDVSSIAYWDVDIEQPGNNFKFSASTDHGDGTITVSSGSNYQGSAREAKLIVSARNFHKTVEIPIYQAALQFDMTPEPSYPEISELGGDVNLAFTSTVEWTFTVQPNSANSSDKGDMAWLTFNPSLPGVGNRREINAIATWSQNFTEEPRVITLALEATNENVMERLEKLPEPFTLRQAAGTAPTNLQISSGDITFSTAQVTINYRSVSDVKDCGVILRESGQDASEGLKISASQSSYNHEGPVTMTLTGLDEGKTYVAVPYVENMVRTETAYDVTTEFTVKQHGASVRVNEVVSGQRLVEVTFTVISDFDLKEASLEIMDLSGNRVADMGLNISGIFGVNDEMHSQEFTIRTEEILVPKTDYVGFIVLHSETGNGIARTDEFTFRTLGYIPGSDDNNPPQ